MLGSVTLDVCYVKKKNGEKFLVIYNPHIGMYKKNQCVILNFLKKTALFQACFMHV